MKKVQRSFIVEYKSGRQKSEPKSNSIWGEIDLKSVAKKVEQDAMPFGSNTHAEKKSDGDTSILTDEPAKPLHASFLQHATTEVTDETFVANGDDAVFMAASEKPVKKTRAKRGSKTVVAKPSKATARTSLVSTAASDTSTATGAFVEFDDCFADLLKLEEENKSLRKQLSEKLRVENADLRKRLGQN